MASFYVVESGRLIEEAKRAALDAGEGYGRLNAYTIGVAVQAAADVLRLAAGGGGGGGGGGSGSNAGLGSVVDVDAIEVTPRLRALESVVAAARRLHGDGGDDCCELCTALGRLAAVDRAS